MSTAADWHRPPRQMIGTAWFYLHTDQWRYDPVTSDGLASPGAEAEKCTFCYPRIEVGPSNTALAAPP